MILVHSALPTASPRQAGINHAEPPATSGNDVLMGLANEANTLIGLAGNDTMHGANLGDYINGGVGADYGIGYDGADTLIGEAGNDTLYGMTGEDFFEYEAGNVGDVDVLSGGGGDDTAYGGSMGTTRQFSGDGGDDVMICYQAIEKFNGGTGEDLVDYHDSAAVQVNLLLGTGSGNYAAGDTYVSVEDAIGGYDHDVLIGSGKSNMIDGAGGNDTVIGGSGADELFGGSGMGDVLDYSTSNGAVVISLLEGVGHGGHAEDDQFDGFEFVHGSTYDDRIIGDFVNNELSGDDGRDHLSGGGGLDSLLGGDGNDTLKGGADRDFITGGAGADRILYVDYGDSGNAADTRDKIFGFSSAEGDQIDLSLLDANTTLDGNQSFTFIGSGAFTGVAGQLRAYSAGGYTYVEADHNGNGSVDFSLILTGAPTVSVGDFVL